MWGFERAKSTVLRQIVNDQAAIGLLRVDGVAGAGAA
jgi:hypothetical protein